MKIPPEHKDRTPLLLKSNVTLGVHTLFKFSNYLFQILKLHMVLFKSEMILENNKLFYTEKNFTTKSNTI